VFVPELPLDLDQPFEFLLEVESALAIGLVFAASPFASGSVLFVLPRSQC
jgi:hypothetical protein